MRRYRAEAASTASLHLKVETLREEVELLRRECAQVKQLIEASAQ
jgi:hypothetical protein